MVPLRPALPGVFFSKPEFCPAVLRFLSRDTLNEVTLGIIDLPGVRPDELDATAIRRDGDELQTSTTDPARHGARPIPLRGGWAEKGRLKVSGLSRRESWRRIAPGRPKERWICTSGAKERLPSRAAHTPGASPIAQELGQHLHGHPNERLRIWIRRRGRRPRDDRHHRHGRLPRYPAKQALECLSANDLCYGRHRRCTGHEKRKDERTTHAYLPSNPAADRGQSPPGGHPFKMGAISFDVASTSSG